MSYREYLTQLARFNPYKDETALPDGTMLQLTTRGHTLYHNRMLTKRARHKKIIPHNVSPALNQNKLANRSRRFRRQFHGRIEV